MTPEVGVVTREVGAERFGAPTFESIPASVKEKNALAVAISYFERKHGFSSFLCVAR